MSRRSRDWNTGLAKDLRSSKFAREFILACLEEGITLQQALGKVIRAYGVKEFSIKTKIPSANLLRAVNPAHNPTVATLDKILAPFGLQISVSEIEQKKRFAA